jgi:hemolysin D
MLVNAEVHLGTCSVVEYLLSPVQKVAHEAGRER